MYTIFTKKGEMRLKSRTKSFGKTTVEKKIGRRIDSYENIGEIIVD